MLTRRQLIAGMAGTFLLPDIAAASKGESTGTPETLPRISDEIAIDHVRVLGPGVTGNAVALGAFVNTTDAAIDAPMLIEGTLRDHDNVIVTSAFALPVYPVLPPGERIGFVMDFTGVAIDAIDPDSLRIDAKVNPRATSEVERLEAATFTVDSAELVGVDDKGLRIEVELTNTSGGEFRHGVTPNVAVWDADGRYCGNAYANVNMTIPDGDTVRFTTMSHAGLFNPMDIAGDDFDWELWITPS